MGKVIIDIATTLGKAVLAGVGVELARLASLHLRKRLGPTDDANKEPTPEELKAENAKLKAELEQLKTELEKGAATARS